MVGSKRINKIDRIQIWVPSNFRQFLRVKAAQSNKTMEEVASDLVRMHQDSIFERKAKNDRPIWGKI